MGTLSHKKMIPHIGKAQKKKLQKASVEVVYADYDEIKPVLSEYKFPKDGKGIYLLVIEREFPKAKSLKSEIKSLGFKTLPKEEEVKTAFNVPVPQSKHKKVLQELQNLLEVSQEDLANVIGCSSRTLWRVLNEKNGHFKNVGHKNGLNRLVELINLLIGIEVDLQKWLQAPQKSFKGKKPVDLLKNGDIECVFRWAYMQLEGRYK